MELSEIKIGVNPNWGVIEAKLQGKIYYAPGAKVSDHIMDVSAYLSKGEKIIPSHLTNRDYLNRYLRSK